MDRLKQRFFNTKTKKYVQQSEAYCGYYVIISGTVCHMSESASYGSLSSPSKVDHIIVEQCIGRDYDDNLIYENDMLRHPDGTVFCAKWNPAYCGYRAVYSDGMCMSLSLQVDQGGRAIVIGNIRENPDKWIGNLAKVLP